MEWEPCAGYRNRARAPSNTFPQVEPSLTKTRNSPSLSTKQEVEKTRTLYCRALFYTKLSRDVAHVGLKPFINKWCPKMTSLRHHKSRTAW
eukprot:5197711-Amphidinium_carterae.1